MLDIFWKGPIGNTGGVDNIEYKISVLSFFYNKAKKKAIDLSRIMYTFLLLLFLSLKKKKGLKNFSVYLIWKPECICIEEGVCMFFFFKRRSTIHYFILSE